MLLLILFLGFCLNLNAFIASHSVVNETEGFLQFSLLRTRFLSLESVGQPYIPFPRILVQFVYVLIYEFLVFIYPIFLGFTVDR